MADVASVVVASDFISANYACTLPTLAKWAPVGGICIEQPSSGRGGYVVSLYARLHYSAEYPIAIQTTHGLLQVVSA